MKTTQKITRIVAASLLLATLSSAGEVGVKPFLRRDDADVKATPDTMKGALFSYSRDYERDIEQWVARTVFGLRISEDDSIGTVGYWDLTASALIDKVSSGGFGLDQTDVLNFTFAGSSQIDLPDSLDWFATSFLATASVVDSTSTDFDRHVVGGMLDFEFFGDAATTKLFPFAPHGLGFGKSGSIGPLYLVPTFGLHFEGGTVASGETAEDVSKEFVRGGPRLGLHLAPQGIDDPSTPANESNTAGALKLFAGYQYYWDLLGDGQDSSQFLAEAAWDLGGLRLIEGSQTKLTVSYRRGEIPFSALDDESVLVGLAIGF